MLFLVQLGELTPLSVGHLYVNRERYFIFDLIYKKKIGYAPLR